MRTVFIIVLFSVINSAFSQNDDNKFTEPGDSTLLKDGGRIITLIDNNDFCVFTEYDIFLETVKSYLNSPAAKKIYEVFINYKGTGNIIADSAAGDPGLSEKLRMVKGVVISTGKILILNKITGNLEKQMTREYDKNMCTTLKTGNKTITWYCMGQN